MKLYICDICQKTFKEGMINGRYHTQSHFNVADNNTVIVHTNIVLFNEPDFGNNNNPPVEMDICPECLANHFLTKLENVENAELAVHYKHDNTDMQNGHGTGYYSHSLSGYRLEDE